MKDEKYFEKIAFRWFSHLEELKRLAYASLPEYGLQNYDQRQLAAYLAILREEELNIGRIEEVAWK